MNDLIALIPVFALLLLIFAFAFFAVRHDRKLAKIWETVAEGEFARAEYSHYYYSRRSGAMVHTTSHYRVDLTTIHFTGGLAIVARGHHELPYPVGTPIRIRRNKLGDFQIEKI